MNFSFTNENNLMLVRKIGLTLLHSLWIGILLAAATGLVLVLTKKTKPEIRYNMLTGLLCLFVLTVGFTFFSIGPKTAAIDNSYSQVSTTSVHTQILPAALAQPQIDFVSTISTFLVHHAQSITLLWLLVIAFKSLRLGIGLYRLEYLKTNQVCRIDERWEKKVAWYAKEMGIAKPVKVMQSGLVKIPMVLGHFKPLILVPLGVVASIPSDQIEMVLLHELAHIKRLDFFVNFLQHLTELLFFFNPAVLWVSTLIRKERENCCDDMALRYSGNKIIYINALLSFREYQLENPVYSVAFNGESGLVQRVRRIASRTNSTLKLSEKIILAVSVLMLFTFTILFAKNTVPTGIKHALKPRVQLYSKQKTSGAAAKAAQENMGTPVNQPILKVSPDFRADSSNQNKYQLQALVPLTGPMQPDTLKRLQAGQQQLIRLNPLQKLQEGQFDIQSQTGLKDIDRAYDSLARKYDADKYATYQPVYQYKPYKIEKNERLAAFNERILSEIEKNGIEISRNNVDFHITNNELIVNGVKVPDYVHQKVISAVIAPNDRIDFTYGSHHDK